MTENSIETRIAVFESQVRGWILDHARWLASPDYPKNEDAGFAILTLITSYFETIASFASGDPSKGRETEFFWKGVNLVLPESAGMISAQVSDAEAQIIKKEIYSQLRCGLYHEAGPKAKVAITRNSSCFEVVFETKSPTILRTIVVDPWSLLTRIEIHFAEFIDRLRDQGNAELRDSFERFFAYRSGADPNVLPTHVSAARTSTYGR